jgi:hypothetical protein
LDTKTVALFSVATVVLGLAASFGLPGLSPTGVIPTIFAGLGFMAYAFAMGFGISALSLRRFEKLDNLVTVRK